MSTAAALGALRVIIGGDTSELDKSLQGSQSSIAAWAKGVGLGLAAVAVAVAGVATAFGMSVKAQIDVADQLNKTSQKAGLTTQELSRLSYAADLSDVSSETLGKSMTKLSKTLVGAANDGASPAAQAFQQMGVAVRNQDGTLRSSSAVLADVAEKFAGYKDGAAKTALATELFGKAGAQLIPLLNQGRDGLQQAGDEAERFGLVLDKKTTMAAEAFNDNLKRLEKSKQGIVMTITAQLLPSFEALSDVLVKSRTGGVDLWVKAGEGLATMMNGLVSAGAALITTWQQIFATAANLKTAFSQLASGDIAGAWDTMKKSATDTGAAVSELAVRMQQLWRPDETDAAMKQMAMSVDAFMGTVKQAGEYMKTDAPWKVRNDDSKALDNFLKTQEKRIAATQAEAETVGKSAAEQAQLKLIYEAQAIALANNIPLTEALQQRIANAGTAAAQASMQLQAAQIAVQAMSPEQRFAQDLQVLQTVYDSTNMSMETFAARQQQIAQAAGATWGQAGESIAGSFKQIAGAFGKESSAMAKAAQVFGIIQGTISMYTGAAKALELPFPANIAAMAAVLAKGASLVASIKSQSVPTGYASGGLVMGPGSSRSDSVPAMLSRGEFVVNADAASKNMGALQAMNSGGAAPQANRTLVVQGRVFTSDLFREVFDFLNDGMADGHKLNVKFA